MTLAELIAQVRAQLATKLAERNTRSSALADLRGQDSPDEAQIATVRGELVALDAELDTMQARIAELESDKARDDAADRLSRDILPAAGRPAYDRVARIGAEERTYRKDKDPKGVAFCRDVLHSNFGDFSAAMRLARHMDEERVERGKYLDGDQERAVGTGAFSGLAVPQYLTDMFAPMATNGRPFADACNHHDLPPTGMTVNIGRGTTGTSAANQASENSAASETNYDDTLLTINVQTAAGQQTVSRQGAERGVQVEDTIVSDLFKRYAANLDSNLINQASTGLTNVANAITYTDASPTVPETYGSVVAALAGVEAALTDVASGDNLAIMHSRRWYWLQNGLSATWPLISQPGIVEQTLGANYQVAYGKGIRGLLPNGTAVLVDNNVPTNLGGGTNQDEIYTVDKQECHLWEDPNAPFFIRADQTLAASLGLLLVVYGYYAYTFQRYAFAQKVSGTGLVTPAFTGV